jgi:hypothetical protein
MAGVAMTALLVAAGPAEARPALGNAKPKILSIDVARHDATIELTVVARDRDDVVRGLEVDWGEAGQGSSACTIVRGRDADRHRRGKQRRLHASYTFAAAGDQHITVRALSGGCTANRPEQRSAARTVHVHVG